MGPALVRAAGVAPGQRVLDVGAGTGNATLPAAAAGAHVVGTDVAPELMAIGERAAKDQGLSVTWQVADAQDLPFPDATFDVVLSAVGAMFAPDHERTARELLRVCRPGGTIAMANWTPDGEVGRFFAILARYAPPAPGPPPTAWGDPATVARLLAPGHRDDDAVPAPPGVHRPPGRARRLLPQALPTHAGDVRAPRRRAGRAVDRRAGRPLLGRLRPRVPDGGGGHPADRCTTGRLDRSFGLSLPAAPSTSFCVFWMRASSRPDSA